MADGCRTCDMIRGLLMSQGLSAPAVAAVSAVADPVLSSAETQVKRKVKTAYRRAYDKAFKALAPKFKTKAGKWVKNGFKRAVKAAHAEARRRMK